MQGGKLMHLLTCIVTFGKSNSDPTIKFLHEILNFFAYVLLQALRGKMT